MYMRRSSVTLGFKLILREAKDGGTRNYGISLAPFRISSRVEVIYRYTNHERSFTDNKLWPKQKSHTVKVNIKSRR